MTTAHDPVDFMLSRLDGVRKTTSGWVAKCPSHEDRTASLSVAAGDDGRVLLHCFASCTAADVVHALGLELANLFPARLPPTTPQERKALQRHARESQWQAALNVLGREMKVVWVFGQDLADGRVPPEQDKQRFLLAMSRIDAAREVLG